MNFRRDIVKKCVAQMCINLGWESITSSALDTLTNILENYFFSMAHNIHVASELNDHPEPSLQDLCLSFEKFDVTLSDLSEYILQADHSPLPYSVPYFPALRHKANIKYEQKVSSNKDGLITVEKKQGTDCLTPIKNAKVVPEEAESSQYEMKSFSLVTLENGDLFPQVKGLIPSSKICKPLPAEEPLKLSRSSKNVQVNKSFSDVCKEKSESISTKVPKQSSNIIEDHDKKTFNNKKETIKTPFISPKKHRKPTIKEAFIAKKKQSKSAKLASSMVKIDSMSDTNIEVNKKRPGRKPKKTPKSKIHVRDDDEINTNIGPDVQETSGGLEKRCDSLLEVVGHTIGVEENDTMIEDDLELGAVNDEILVEIADQGGDSPLPHLPGMVEIQNKELFPSSEIFNNTCPANESGTIGSNVDIEEEISSWSDDEKLMSNHANVHKATGLELILRSQGDGSNMNNALFKSPEKHKKDSNAIFEKDKKKFKKLKKLKKSQKPEKIPKIKKNKCEFKEKPVVVPDEERAFEALEIPIESNDKYMLSKVDNSHEILDNDSDMAEKMLFESSDYNLDQEMLQSNIKVPVQTKPNTEFLESVKINTNEFVEVLHKKKKKKGKRKMEDDGGCTLKSKKFKKQENNEIPFPKLTLKFGGATVCGGDASSIKLVIKPISNQSISSLPEAVHPSINISPLAQCSPSSDKLSQPSATLSSGSPSDDIARLASGPSNRKNFSSIYSDSSTPPHDGHSTSKVYHPERHLSPEVKIKIKEPKSTPVKSSPISKSSGSKSTKSAIISETVGKITKANGEIIWICPTCGCPDSGTPMIGCDRCDDWYHWVCVNIVKEPPAEMNWYCVRCLNQNPSLKGQGTNKRGRPAGKGKSKK